MPGNPEIKQKPGLEERLTQLSERARQALGGAASTMGDVTTICAGALLFFIADTITRAIGNRTLWEAVFYGFGIIVLVVIWPLSRKLIKVLTGKLCRRYYIEIRKELEATSILALVVDGACLAAIRDRVRAQFGLPWISPPPVKSVEQQLETAACYHELLSAMRSGDRRNDDKLLWRGAVSYVSDRQSGEIFGCLSLLLFSIFGYGIIVAAWLWRLRRFAALAAYCDCLLVDRDALITEASPIKVLDHED